jgi:hypothetical protein
MPRLFPAKLPEDATDEALWRYVRHWAVVGAVLAVPVYAVVLSQTTAPPVLALLVAVTTLTVLNIVSLTRKIRHAQDDQGPPATP